MTDGLAKKTFREIWGLFWNCQGQGCWDCSLLSRQANSLVQQKAAQLAHLTDCNRYLFRAAITAWGGVNWNSSQQQISQKRMQYFHLQEAQWHRWLFGSTCAGRRRRADLWSKTAGAGLMGFGQAPVWSQRLNPHYHVPLQFHSLIQKSPLHVF